MAPNYQSDISRIKKYVKAKYSSSRKLFGIIHVQKGIIQKCPCRKLIFFNFQELKIKVFYLNYLK